MINVVHVNTFYFHGGAGNAMVLLHEGLKKTGIDSHILLGYSDSHSHEHTFQKSNLPPFVKFGINNLRSKILSRDIETIPIDLILNNPLIQHADIIHCHNLHGSYFNLQSLIQLSNIKPIVWTLHDMWSITGHCAYSLDCNKWERGCVQCPYMSSYQELLFDTSNTLWNTKKQIYSSSRLTVITPSTWLESSVKKSMLQKQHIATIRYGIDTALYNLGNKDTIRKKLFLPKKKKILLFVASGGIGNVWKGWKYIQPIMETVSKVHNAHFVCIGGKRVPESKEDFVTYIPTVNDPKILADYYRASDVLLLPSIADNCPFVLLEAFSCGLPAIAFRVGGIPEVIHHKKNGYICDVVGSDEMIQGINYLLQRSVKEMEQMRICARETITKKYVYKTMIQNYVQLYKTLV